MPPTPSPRDWYRNPRRMLYNVTLERERQTTLFEIKSPSYAKQSEGHLIHHSLVAAPLSAFLDSCLCSVMFFRVLITATLSSEAVLGISQTKCRRFRTTLLPLFWEFLKLNVHIHFSLLLSIGCLSINGYSTNSSLCYSCLYSTRLLLT